MYPGGVVAGEKTQPLAQTRAIHSISRASLEILCFFGNTLTI